MIYKRKVKEKKEKQIKAKFVCACATARQILNTALEEISMLNWQIVFCINFLLITKINVIKGEFCNWYGKQVKSNHCKNMHEYEWQPSVKTRKKIISQIDCKRSHLSHIFWQNVETGRNANKEARNSFGAMVKEFLGLHKK